METDEALESLARRIASLEAFLAQQGYRAEHPTAPRLSRTMGEESLVHMATPPQVSTTERLSQAEPGR